MLTRHVAFVSESSAVSASLASAIAAALQKQVTRDFAPLWNVSATVSYFPTLDDVPTGYWPVIVQDQLDDPSAGGYHTDKNGQPYALIRSDGEVSLTASHECLEMLADPFGNRLQASASIKPGQGRVEYLVEVCDPCEGTNFGYTVNGLKMSDFYTPHYFDPVTASGVRYCFTGAVKQPRQLLQGGYLSWLEPVSGHMWQAFYFGAKITYKDLGKPPAGKSLREWVDGQTRPEIRRRTGGKKRALVGVPSDYAEASRAQAQGWRDSILALSSGQ